LKSSRSDGFRRAVSPEPDPASDEPEPDGPPPAAGGSRLPLRLLGLYGLVTVGFVLATAAEVSLLGLAERALSCASAALGGPTPVVIPRRPRLPVVGPVPVDIETTVPLRAYLLAVLGASIRVFAAVAGPLGDVIEFDDAAGAGAGTDPDRTPAGLSAQQLLALPAAVCLAAGLVLVRGLSTEVVDLLGPEAVVPTLGLVAGLGVKPAYRALGGVADRILDRVGPAGDDADRTALDRLTRGGAATAGLTRGARLRGWALFGLLAGTVGLAAALLGPPPDVVVYATMGGLGYVFTTVVVDADRASRRLVTYYARIVLGVVLAVVGHLVLAPTPGATAAVAFLVGLYPKVLVNALTGLVRRALDGLGRQR
jgi:hypothetical protein